MMNKKLVKAGTVVALIAAMGGSFLTGCAQKVSAVDSTNVKVKTVLDKVIDAGTYTELDRETVMNGIESVKTERDMFDLINKVTYFQAYFPEKCQFDYRSENVGIKPNWTTDYVMNEENRKEVEMVVNEAGNELKNMTRGEMEAANHYWESILTTVTNCNNKTMTIRFFEDDSRVLELGFNK